MQRESRKDNPLCACEIKSHIRVLQVYANDLKYILILGIKFVTSVSYNNLFPSHHSAPFRLITWYNA